MRLRRYRGRHLRPRPRTGSAAAVGAAATVCMAGSASAHPGAHVVRRGETLSAIASRYGTTVARLATANDLADPNLIVAGTRLRIPGRGGSRGGGGAGGHVVSRGETLSGIAARYGTTVGALARANGISNPNLVVAGKRLTVPNGGGGTASGGGGSATHVVSRGETLSGIAARYGTTVAAVARANGISNPNLVVAGKRLTVPNGGGGTGSASVEVLLEHAAVAHGLDPALVKAIAWQESGWRQKARSSAGAIGVMQVMPGTADQVNSWTGSRLNARRAADNIELGVRYLRYLLDRMPNERKALAGYYTGPGAVGRRLSSVQRPYVRSVLALKRRF